MNEGRGGAHSGKGVAHCSEVKKKFTRAAKELPEEKGCRGTMKGLLRYGQRKMQKGIMCGLRKAQ